ncbi:SDR family oxidoreductase [Paenibacillus arenilitoris]|uniref:SDR family oxidoreductase n=1 Tax=Paenibacillus arenilitoris TaxID=2772299 RepID=A0A927CQV7_9BACL|nr:SDR family oxidoreductase [Paenibacillus arenilitoris]MBD2870266.1 SDR family oxidoreductase [Paenibacillus arenilitoris]
MNQSLAGKTAIVTGASRGIGRVLAQRLASQGAKVAVNYYSNRDQAEEIAEQISRTNGQAVAVQADVSKVGDIRKLFEETAGHFGGIDILINNAGLGIMKPVEAITEEDFDRVFNLNVKGSYFASQLAADYMKEDGSIVNFSTSVIGLMLPAYSLYAASKGAVEQFTRHLAKELAPRGIRINAVAPGPIQTEFFMAGKSEELIERFKQMNAFNRLGEPEDVAGVVQFLLSEEAGWITGQTLRVNGGMV